MLLLERDPFTSKTEPIGEVKNIISRNSEEEIIKYREQGYKPIPIENSERVAIVKPLYERKDFRNM